MDQLFRLAPKLFFPLKIQANESRTNPWFQWIKPQWIITFLMIQNISSVANDWTNLDPFTQADPRLFIPLKLIDFELSMALWNFTSHLAKFGFTLSASSWIFKEEDSSKKPLEFTPPPHLRQTLTSTRVRDLLAKMGKLIWIWQGVLGPRHLLTPPLSGPATAAKRKNGGENAYAKCRKFTWKSSTHFAKLAKCILKSVSAFLPKKLGEGAQSRP